MDVPFQHKPVLLQEVMELLSPVPGGVYCDATVGGGGHAETLLEMTSPDGRVVGIDRDMDAVAAASRRLERFGDRVSIFHGRFSALDEILSKVGISRLDGLLLDLGISSHKVEQASRGFSFMRAGPLDMRMDASQGETAAGLLRRTSEDELADTIYKFGGERLSRKVARSIKRMEADGNLATTADLAVAVRRVVGRSKKGGIDPGEMPPPLRTSSRT